MTKILISPQYGIGFFTENQMRYPQCLTDSEIIDLVEAGSNWASIQAMLIGKYPLGSWYCDHLEVVEVPDNCKFVIVQNNGFEHLRIGHRVCTGSSNLVEIVDGIQKMPKYFEKLLTSANK